MRLFWRIFITFFACAMAALVLTAWFANQSLRQFYQQQVEQDLKARATILASRLETQLPAASPAEIDRYCKELARLTQTRLTVILPDGSVIGESESSPAEMESHLNRPEIQTALDGRMGRSIRFSDTTRRTLMYLAVPVHRDGAVAAAARASLPLSVIDLTLNSLNRRIALGAYAAAAVFALVTFFLARRISRPLDAMRQTAERLTAGDLRARVARPKGAEMQSLARALNQMAAQLDERLATITRQNDQQRAVFASMVEGVLAVDSEGRILDLNAAAGRFLELVPGSVLGRSLQETVRNLDFQAFVAQSLAADTPTEGEIILYGQDERFLQLHGSALADPAGRKLGALVVLNDITRVKRLETVRRDFVANVSHELKTPITALKGCVETLSDRSARNPEDEARFIAMMDRQVGRLNAIVEDLLSLSRIEHDAERRGIPMEPGAICDVIRRASLNFAGAAAARKIVIETSCPETLSAPINAALLEQAVGNLIDNAVKYSGEGTRVLVSAMARETEIEIRVADQGPGIEKKHLSRIFERFYRVDQARSRSLGGTGLGLAIVKHIALAHGGSASVESIPGQGSVFTLRIPKGA
jgi:two-component system phosphate regulon sensor histidine kinase PhoR